MAIVRAAKPILALSALLGRALAEDGGVTQCVGKVKVKGIGQQAVVATQLNQPGMPAGPVMNIAGNVRPDMWGRAYFANGCTEGTYSNTEYSAWKLLGKRLTYTTDVSQAGCGCNAAMYLVSMPQNDQVSGCEDYYCDANTVCGVNCHEIDIQEANRFAFHSALHKEYDGNGLAQGFGGWVRDNKFDFNGEQYGPGGKCVNTGAPYNVSVSFPTNAEGKLAAMEVKLSQGGECDIVYSMDKYPADPNFEKLTTALSEGMTPVLSYWKADDMLWLDGPGLGGGPCQEDTVQCNAAPQFYGFSVEDL